MRPATGVSPWATVWRPPSRERADEAAACRAGPLRGAAAHRRRGGVVSPIPVIAVVGYPNAGKSTLVNRLSGTRTTVVHETPGVTRDRKAVDVEWNGRHLTLLDTGGFDVADRSRLAEEIRSQVDTAIAEADAVLFVVDAQGGTAAGRPRDRRPPASRPGARRARGQQDRRSAPGRSRGAVLRARSRRAAARLGHARHGHGRPARQPAGAGPRSGRCAGSGRGGAAIPVAIVGRPNAGKSSLLNALVGREARHRERGAGHDARRHRHDGRAAAGPLSLHRHRRHAQGGQGVRRRVLQLPAQPRQPRARPRGDRRGRTSARHGRARRRRRHRGRRGGVAPRCSRPTSATSRRPTSTSCAGSRAQAAPAAAGQCAVSALTGAGLDDLLDVVARLESRYTAHIPTPELNRALAVANASAVHAGPREAHPEDVLHRAVRHHAASFRGRRQRPRAPSPATTATSSRTACASASASPACR